MPQQTKIFRVFVSSTFTDMKEERKLLQKKVFPELEKFCEKNGAKFQAVDLRWGVNEESQLNQKTLDICLNEIARCQKISPKPNFIILLGTKYGWQPIPPKIHKDEMEKILPVLDIKENKLIKQWYRLDTNAISAEYVLQPRVKDDTWGKIEVEIRDILRKTVSKLSFKPGHLVKYHASATHQEIMAGALQPPENTINPEEHVLALFRNINGLPNDRSADGFIDLLDQEPDPYCVTRLANLKMALKEKLGDHCIPYQASWKNGKSTIDDPTDFENQVYRFLQRIIEQQIKEVISPDEIKHEVKLHNEFKERLTEHFCGREDILNRIKSYLYSASEKRTMALIGESGSGKSSVMAKAIQRYQMENSSAVTVYRFIGISSSSSNLLSLLLSICGQIARGFNVTLNSLAGAGKEKSLTEMNGLTEVFKKCLALGSMEKPVVVFLDALDQLSESDSARSLYWVPRELPDHVKLVVSLLPELEGHLNSIYIEYLPILPKQEAEKILEIWLLTAKRKLTDEQHQEIIEKFGNTGLPIYLKLAFERARHWHSYETNISLQADIKGIINNFMDGLEEEHTQAFVEHVISYILCGKYGGLAENEILEILVFDKEYWDIFLSKTHPEHRDELEDVARIPIIVWSRLFLDLEPFLTERDADGIPIITFFHRQFIEVLKERYQLSDDDNIN